MKLREISFGQNSAEAEIIREPNLLLEGYLDENGITEIALKGYEYLFLGYKGSGKTALSKRLCLMSQSDPLLFIESIELQEFPHKTLKEIVSGSVEVETKYPIAWSWLLLLVLINSFNKDSGILWNDYRNTIDFLTRFGMLPVRNLNESAMTSKKREFKVNLGIFEASLGKSSIKGEDIQLVNFVEHLKDLIKNVSSSSKHLIIIDGLDNILSTNEAQYSLISALIKEAGRLNDFFREHSVPAKIIILCRTDLFEKLSDPNKNKVRQSFTYEFDWYHDPSQPLESNLVKIANLRAKLKYPQINDLFKTFLPPQHDYKDIYLSLFNHTRHTPRDFLQLLKCLQKFSDQGIMKHEEIWSSIRDYSINYFLPEIRDELDGYVSNETIEATIKVLTTLRKQYFNFFEIERMAEKLRIDSSIDFVKALEVMYDCSAIGHIEEHNGGREYFFKFWNKRSNFYVNKKIMVHRGLWKALGITR